jgi:hypothetical protein
MLERIATIITAVLFTFGLIVGLFLSIIDIIATYAIGHSLTGISPLYSVAVIVIVPPIALTLIYFGSFLDKVFKTENKTFSLNWRKKS